MLHQMNNGKNRVRMDQHGLSSNENFRTLKCYYYSGHKTGNKPIVLNEWMNDWGRKLKAKAIACSKGVKETHIKRMIVVRKHNLHMEYDFFESCRCMRAFDARAHKHIKQLRLLEIGEMQIFVAMNWKIDWACKSSLKYELQHRVGAHRFFWFVWIFVWHSGSVQCKIIYANNFGMASICQIGWCCCVCVFAHVL